MTRDDEELLAGAVTFIRHQPTAFRDRMFDIVRRLTTDVPFYKRFILDHYDDKPETRDVYAFYDQLQETPPPRGDWKTGAFFDAIKSADGCGHTTAAEIIDAVIMECYYRQLIQRGEPGEHRLRAQHAPLHKEGWRADS